MAVEPYGVLKGRAIKLDVEARGRSPHYQVLVQAGPRRFRLAVNVKSVKGRAPDRDLLVALERDWRNPMRGRLAGLPHGFTPLDRDSGLALDYVRGGLVACHQMVPVPAFEPGDNNDLVDMLNLVFGVAVDEEVDLYAWGMRWGPEPGHPDEVFGFDPGDGIHNIHMNQGSRGKHAVENAPWQDGAIAGHRRQRNEWVAIFLAFQNQCWETSDRGEPLVPAAD